MIGFGRGKERPNVNYGGQEGGQWKGTQQNAGLSLNDSVNVKGTTVLDQVNEEIN